MNKSSHFVVTPHKLSLCVIGQNLLDGGDAWNGKEETKYALSLYLVDEISVRALPQCLSMPLTVVLL